MHHVQCKRDLAAWPRWLFSGLTPQRAGHNSRPVHVRFVDYKVALGQVFLQVLQFSHQYHTTNAPFSFIYHSCYITATDRNSKTRQAIDIQHNTEVRLCNHSWSGKAVTIIYYDCVFVALVIQHAICMNHTVICGLSSSTVFFHIIS
jgi:hypothetical protein